jgi:hypothetical protein
MRQVWWTGTSASSDQVIHICITLWPTKVQSCETNGTTARRENSQYWYRAESWGWAGPSSHHCMQPALCQLREGRRRVTGLGPGTEGRGVGVLGCWRRAGPPPGGWALTHWEAAYQVLRMGVRSPGQEEELGRSRLLPYGGDQRRERKGKRECHLKSLYTQ